MTGERDTDRDDDEPRPADADMPERPSLTRLLVADLLIAGGALLAQKLVEKHVLKGAVPKATRTGAKGEPSDRKARTARKLSRIGTASVPGAILVGSGLLGKLLFDRSEKYRRDHPRNTKG